MKIENITQSNISVASITGDGLLITDLQSALDLMMTAKYETGSTRLAIDKKLFTEEFFILSTGLAGEILQKFINYGMKVAIYGDFSGYTSKPLKDFIYESNHGKDIFFQPTLEDAVNKLTSE